MGETIMQFKDINMKLPSGISTFKKAFFESLSEPLLKNAILFAGFAQRTAYILTPIPYKEFGNLDLVGFKEFMTKEGYILNDFHIYKTDDGKYSLAVSYNTETKSEIYSIIIRSESNYESLKKAVELVRYGINTKGYLSYSDNAVQINGYIDNNYVKECINNIIEYNGYKLHFTYRDKKEFMMIEYRKLKIVAE